MNNDTLCRCCGQPMEAKTQDEQIQTNSKGQSRIIPAYTIVTCWQPSCTLYGYTFDTRSYGGADLSQYKKAVR